MTGAAVAQNWFATLALLAWPLVALWLYQTRPVSQATLWTILGGYLLLPVGASIKLGRRHPPARQDFDTGACCTCGLYLLCKAPLAILERIWIGGSFVAHVI